MAYRLTLGQFSDVVAQEMCRDPGTDLDLDDLWDLGRHRLGPGRYESLHVVGRIDDLPVVTFTTPSPLPPNPPAAAYLATMARGISDTHGWSADEVADYLLSRPGVGDDWDVESLWSLVAARVPSSRSASALGERGSAW